MQMVCYTSSRCNRAYFCLFLSGFLNFGFLNLSLINLFVRNRKQLENNGNTSEEVASSSQETGSSSEYESTLSNGTLLPGHSRGTVAYEGDYRNTSLSWYDRLRSIRPFAVDCLRNTRENVEESGRLVGDDLNGNEARSSGSANDTMERSPAVTLSSWS